MRPQLKQLSDPNVGLGSEIVPMTTFRYTIGIGDSAGQRFETVEAWVDTGASYSLVPSSILHRLGHSPTYRRPFRMADGSIVELGLIQLTIRIGQETRVVSCVFGEEGREPLLGATAVEEFALGVDPVNHTLAPLVLNLHVFSPGLRSGG